MRPIMILAALAVGICTAQAANLGDCGTAAVNGEARQAGAQLQAGDRVRAIKGDCRMANGNPVAINDPGLIAALEEKATQPAPAPVSDPELIKALESKATRGSQLAPDPALSHDQQGQPE